MTRTRTAIAIILTAVTTALAGYQVVGAAASTTPANSDTAQSFVTPRIEGRRLDVRYSESNPADPAMTAERFCRLSGFDSVAGFSVQSVSATRMIGDFSEHTGSHSAFYAIRCEGRAAAPVLALR